MPSSLRKPVVAGVFAGVLTALAVFGGTGAFLAAAQDTDTTQSPDTTESPDTTQSPDTTEAPDTTESPDSTAPSDEQAPSAEERQAETDAWRQCMADNGVTLPEPQLDENGRPERPRERPQIDESQREAFQAAIDACGPPPGRMHMGKGGPGRGCPGMGEGHDGTENDQSTPNDTAPSVEGSSFAV
jgi:hypothetical protein